MSDLLRDVRHAIRRLRQSPGFTVIAMLTLALSIAATSAIFTVVDAVILRPLPYKSADRLVRVTSEFQRLGLQDAGLSASELFDYRDRSGVFEEITGVWPITANLTGSSKPERVETVLAGPEYFQMLGAQPQVGRLFGPQDQTPGISPVVVISDALWRRGFGGDRSVIGRTLRIDDDPYEIIGVTTPDFRHPSLTLETEAEVWAPTGWIASPFDEPRHSRRFLPAAIGRLKPGITIEGAQAQLDAFAAGLRRSYPDDYPERVGWAPRVLPLKQDLIAAARPSLLIVMAAVLLVLVIGCANIANLQLARAAAREREVAVRRALGASMARMVREQLIETLVVSLAGGAFGLVLTIWALDALMQLAPAGLPRRAEVELGWRVVAFSLTAAVMTGLAFGLFPAFQAGRASVLQVLKGAGRTSAGGEHARARRALIVGELAIALVLLVGGALLVRSFWRLQQVDAGFDPRGVTMARVWLPQPNNPSQGRYFTQAARARFFRDFLRRVEPQVEHIGLTTSLPLTGEGLATFAVEGWPDDTKEVGTARSSFVAGDYFRTLGVRLVRGRLLNERDDGQHQRSIVINETMARTYWPNQDAIGKRIRQMARGAAPTGSAAPWISVVGIVGDVHSHGLDKPVPPEMYGSMWQISSLSVATVVRPRGATNVEDLLRREIRALDADLPLYAVRPIENLVAAKTASRVFAMRLVGLFGVAALLLASLGIYGVIAYAVGQQRRELGIRIALGAAPSTVVRMVLVDGLRLALIGIALGTGGALATSRLLSGLLFGVSANDPSTFVAIALLLVVVALLACWLPARRAAAVDPIDALRAE
jgi:putative ABC transport system permease protein